MAYATFNAADFSGQIVLSGGHLTALKSGSNTDWASGRSDIAVSSGKWYWEYHIDVIDIGRFSMASVAASNANLAQFLGADSHGFSYYGDAGQKVTNGATSAYGASFTTGDTLSVLLDMDGGGNVEFYKNGVTQGVAFTGLSGDIYAGISLFRNGNQITANFGATAFAYPVPTGYNAGLYSLGNTTSNMLLAF